MNINSAATSTVGTFTFHNNRQEKDEIVLPKVENKTSHSSGTSSVNGSEKVTVVNPIRWKKIEYFISQQVNKRSQQLQDGLEGLFKEGNEKLITSKSSDEYHNYIKELSAAIEGQDFKNAEKIIDKFYSGDKEDIINKVQSLAKSVTDGFWNGLRDQFKEMAVASSRTVYSKGEKPEEALPYVLRAIEKAKKKSEDLAIAPKDLADRVSSSISSGIDSAKSKLENAGQNRYSEDAESVTAATVNTARGNIFGGNENAFAESKNEIEKINDSMRWHFRISDTAIDDYDKETRRRDDDFSKYVRKGGDEFLEAIRSELGEMKLASRYESTAAEEQAYQDYHNEQKQLAGTSAAGQDKLIVDITIRIQDSAIQQNLFSPLKVTEQYGSQEKNEETLFAFPKAQHAEKKINWKI